MEITRTIIPDRYTHQEACDALRVSLSQLRWLIASGFIRDHADPGSETDPDKKGKCRYISRGEIERYIREREGVA